MRLIDALQCTCGLILISQLRVAVAVTSPFGKDTLGVQKNPVLSTDLVFHDAWGPKLAGTADGQNYDPSTIDWSSVIEACRVIIKYENRIGNWALRAAFHDAGANTISTAVGTGSTADATVITAGGADGSLFLTNETLRAENAQHSFSTFVAATLRTLVGFYDISYADGITVLAGVAREILSAGKYDIYTLMPAIDKSNPFTPTVDFLVGRLDSNVDDPYGVLPGPTISTEDWLAYFKPRYNQGAWDGICLMGIHALFTTTGCTKSDNPAYNPHKEKAFTWEGDYSYYPSLLQCDPSLMVEADTPAAVGPLMQPPLQINQTQLDMCKFTSQAFKYEAARSEGRTTALPVGNLADVLPTWSWLNPTSPNNSDYHEVRRTCDSSGNCFEGWPYTMNDGYLGMTSTNASATGDYLVIRQAVKAMANSPDKWNACYGNAYNRLMSQGSSYAPTTSDKSPVGHNITEGVGMGLAISGWECPSGWVSGDGNNTDGNTICQWSCKKRCPSKYMKAPLYCRCSTAPWGSVAYNKLYPSAVVENAAGILVDGLVDEVALSGDFGPNSVLGPFAGGVVADTTTQAFSDQAILTDAQLYPGLDESADEGMEGHKKHCKSRGDSGCHRHAWSIEINEVDSKHGKKDEDLTLKISKVVEKQTKKDKSSDSGDSQAYRGHKYVPGKVPASLAMNDYSQSFTDYQQPEVGYELDYDQLASKGLNTKALILPN